MGAQFELQLESSAEGSVSNDKVLEAGLESKALAARDGVLAPPVEKEKDEAEEEEDTDWLWSPRSRPNLHNTWANAKDDWGDCAEVCIADDDKKADVAQKPPQVCQKTAGSGSTEDETFMTSEAVKSDETTSTAVEKGK